jgi:hypothetical protein
LAGGKVNTYEAGTATPKTTYTDESEGTANANPIILDANGRADIWLDSGSYKFVITDSADVEVDTVDNITGGAANVFGADTFSVSTNTNITAAYKNGIVDCTAALTLSLLAAATAEEGFVVTVKNSSAGQVVVDPDGAELIDGAATKTIEPDGSFIIISTGTAWITVCENYGTTNSKTMTFSGNNTHSGNNTLSGNNTHSGDSDFTGDVRFLDDGELTIATGAITVTGSNHTVDTESDAASDNLDTINGMTDGQILFLSPENTARTIVLTDGVGNIETPDGETITLDNTEKSVLIKYDGALSKALVVSQPPPQGLIVQTVNTSVATSTNGTAQIPNDDTIPQNTEGLEAITLAITPTNTSNKLRIRGQVNVANAGSNQTFCAALFQDSTGDALHCTTAFEGAGNNVVTLFFEYEMTAGTTSSTTFKVRVAGDSSVTTTLNGASSARLYGGVLAHTLTIEEILV